MRLAGHVRAAEMHDRLLRRFWHWTGQARPPERNRPPLVATSRRAENFEAISNPRITHPDRSTQQGVSRGAAG